jgi:hypothetical protein
MRKPFNSTSACSKVPPRKNQISLSAARAALFEKDRRILAQQLLRRLERESLALDRQHDDRSGRLRQGHGNRRTKNHQVLRGMGKLDGRPLARKLLARRLPARRQTDLRSVLMNALRPQTLEWGSVSDEPAELLATGLQNVARQILILHDGRHHLLHVLGVDEEDLLRAGGGNSFLVRQGVEDSLLIASFSEPRQPLRRERGEPRRAPGSSRPPALAP